MNEKHISLIKARGFGNRMPLLPTGMFSEGPIYTSDNEGNLTLNMKYLGSIVVYEDYSLDNIKEFVESIKSK